MHEMQKIMQQKLMESQISWKNSFTAFFANDSFAKEIQFVIDALENNVPFLHMRKISDSFSTIFLPFHPRTIYKEEGFRLDHILDQSIVNPELKHFLYLCAELESLTEHFAYTRDESKIENKELIIAKLKEFLQILPDEKTFYSWVDSIQFTEKPKVL